MANDKKVVYEINESIQHGGVRYHTGEQLIPAELAISLEMLKGATKAEAKDTVKDLPNKLDDEEGEGQGADAEVDEAEEAESEGLPDDFPHAPYFKKAGYTTVEEVRAIEDKTEIDGISENRANDVEEYLTNLSNSEG